MLPVDPVLIQTLGAVEIASAGPREQPAKVKFEKELTRHVEVNKRILEGALFIFRVYVCSWPVVVVVVVVVVVTLLQYGIAQ